MAHCSDTILWYIRHAVFLTATVEACNIISFILRHLRKLCIASGKPRCHAAASNVKGTLVIVSLLTHTQAHSSTQTHMSACLYYLWVAYIHSSKHELATKFHQPICSCRFAFQLKPVFSPSCKLPDIVLIRDGFTDQSTPQFKLKFFTEQASTCAHRLPTTMLGCSTCFFGLENINITHLM